MAALLVNGSGSDTLADHPRARHLNNAVGIGGSTAGIPGGGGGGGGGGNGIIIPAAIVTTGSIGDPPAGTIINYGTIGDSDARSAVAFGTGAGYATVINGSDADTVALIASGSGTSGTGVYIGAPVGGSIQNFATIGSTTSRTGVYVVRSPAWWALPTAALGHHRADHRRRQQRHGDRVEEPERPDQRPEFRHALGDGGIHGLFPKTAARSPTATRSTPSR